MIDDIWVSQELAESLENPQAGLRVKCTIDKLGPSHAHWMNQHPMTKNIEAIETERRESEVISEISVLSTTSISSGRSLASLSKKLAQGRRERPRFLNSKKSANMSAVRK